MNETSGSTAADVRVRLRFITRDPTIRVNEVPLAVPVALNRRGLSEVINHLLGIEGGTKGSAEEEEKDGNTTNASGYDFVIENQLLRCSLDKFLRATGLSTEVTINVEYYRTLQAPIEGTRSKPEDAWVGSLVACQGGREGGVVVAGGYDGKLRCYAAQDCSQSVGEWSQAHTGPVKAVAAFHLDTDDGGKGSVVVTAGKDKLVKTWGLSAAAAGTSNRKKKSTEIAAAAGIVMWPVSVLMGHENSVECVAVRGKQQQVLTGDWSGMMCFWKLEGGGETFSTPAFSSSTITSQKRKKRRMYDVQVGEEAAAVQAVASTLTPVSVLKAHSQCMSGIEWHQADVSRVFTSSWDHSIKSWDLERQDCVQTLNSSRVVTSLAASAGSLVAAGHPDGRLRVWDLRSSSTDNGVEGTSATPGKRVLAGCGSWISGVAWHPRRENVLAALTHDGLLRVWDLRATKPLHTLTAHEGKALASCFGWRTGGEEGAAWPLFTGGADGVVRSFEI
ncbi:microtubule-associated protein ytm1 [Nannochloropsis oceanica]